MLKPEILCHPNIPKPLHGMNPRTILGQEWWDKTRREALARTNHTCTACGVAEKDCGWLEGHEYWDINYKTGACEVKSIEPLCHKCHNFIHSGRLAMIMGKDKTKEEVIDILEHGFAILAQNDLKCYPYTLMFAENLGALTYGVKAYKLPKIEAKWEDYHLIIDGERYDSQFKSYEDWNRFYSREDL
jgi:hypothetical protein